MKSYDSYGTAKNFYFSIIFDYMTAAQDWLDSNYPKEGRGEIKNLLICDVSDLNDKEFCNLIVVDFNNKHFLNPNCSESLSGVLVLSDFVKLEELYIKNQFINKLILEKCSNLKNLQVSNNILREIIWPDNKEMLETIDVSNNNIYAQDLSCFSSFTNLVYLHLGTGFFYDIDDDEEKREKKDNELAIKKEEKIKERINNNIYNRWNGSLIHLEKLKNLEELDINATDIDRGIEKLPMDRMSRFMCGDFGRINARVQKIREICDFEETLALSTNFDDNIEKMRKISEAVIRIRERENEAQEQEYIQI